MKQEIRLVEGSSPKLIALTIEGIIDDGKYIKDIVPLGRTTFLLLLEVEVKKKK